MKCKDCESRNAEYFRSGSGHAVKHGFCRDCYERRVAKHLQEESLGYQDWLPSAEYVIVQGKTFLVKRDRVFY